MPAGRTFVDSDAQVVQHHVIPHDPYRSYLRSGPLRIDLDQDGHPILVEFDFSDESITVDSCLRAPVEFELGSVRFLDFPSRHEHPALCRDESNSLFYIRLSDQEPVVAIQAARGAIWEISADGHLCGLWLLKCQEDPYGRFRRRWRTRVWRQARLRAKTDGSERRLSPISMPSEDES